VDVICFVQDKAAKLWNRWKGGYYGCYLVGIFCMLCEVHLAKTWPRKNGLGQRNKAANRWEGVMATTWQFGCFWKGMVHIVY